MFAEDEPVLHVYSCVYLYTVVWCFEHGESHFSTLCNDDGELGLVVGSCRNILLGRTKKYTFKQTDSHVNITTTPFHAHKNST